MNKFCKNSSNEKSRKGAFTLAEVLITLAIIGVVAALTIPTLVRNYNEYVTVNKVKKFYSTMSKAYQRSMVDNGRADEWKVDNGKSSTTANQLASYLKPYIKIQRDCGTNSGCLGYTRNNKLLNGNNNDVNYNTDSRYYKLILKDGTYVVFRGVNNVYCKSSEGGYTNNCGIIFLDTNGGKQPNTVGKDIFEFEITPDAIKPCIIDDCYKNSSGWGCPAYIIKNGNMNYLH